MEGAVDDVDGAGSSDFGPHPMQMPAIAKTIEMVLAMGICYQSVLGLARLATASR